MRFLFVKPAFCLLWRICYPSWPQVPSLVLSSGLVGFGDIALQLCTSAALVASSWGLLCQNIADGHWAAKQ
jgi:hypothetical protein